MLKLAKKKNKKEFNYAIVALIILIIVVGYVVYINKDRIFKSEVGIEQGIAAVVNGDVITANELNRQYNRIDEQSKLLITKDMFLDQLITVKLLLQEAEKLDIKVDEKEVMNEINEIKEQFESEEDFYLSLEALDSSLDELKKQVEKQLIINELLNKTIISKIEVTDSEVKSFYDQNKELIGNVSFENVSSRIKDILIDEKQRQVLTTYFNQLKFTVDIKTGEEIPKLKKTFKSAKDICEEGEKPIIRLFTTTNCQSCEWIKDAFDKTVKEYVDKGEITAYHWELDTGDNTLTPRVEKGIPKSELDVFKKSNPKSTVPTYVFGCRYIRIGNGYEAENDLLAERLEFIQTIEELLY